MKRNELTTVMQLVIGDRFYKAADKAKAVWVMVEGEKKATAYQTYKYFACPAMVIDHPGLKQAQKERSYKALNKDTQVVFLRHTEDIAHSV